MSKIYTPGDLMQFVLEWCTLNIYICNTIQMWPGVAPVQGQYNQTYLNVMKSIVNDLGSKGIYTILGNKCFVRY
jgi:hypothetical protein